jgi:3,4-dihydroxy 2-butanone 4-phosphate synthase/GTP cyclohydrolase II
MNEMKFNTTLEIIEDIKQGKIVIILDDQDRENEGDFVMAADFVSPEAINFMALYGRGLICTPVSKSIANRIGLNPMVTSNSATHQTAFTITLDAKENISTGISAKDRAYTISLILNETSTQADFSFPGHIFPLTAVDGGVLERRGHTEAAVDLAKLAKLKSAGVICEILKEDGELARGHELFEIAKRFNLKIGTIEDLANYLKENTSELKNHEYEMISSTKMPTKFNTSFNISMFKSKTTNEELMALILGDVDKIKDDALVRFHSECFTGDVLGSLRCDCGEQLEKALETISENGSGILFYLKQEGRGIGLHQKLKAYELQELGFDTVEANLKLGHAVDLRDYSFPISILKKLGIKKVQLITNNPEKIESVKKYGLEVSAYKIYSTVNPYNEFYLKTKASKLGHFLQ